MFLLGSRAIDVHMLVQSFFWVFHVTGVGGLDDYIAIFINCKFMIREGNHFILHGTLKLPQLL